MKHDTKISGARKAFIASTLALLLTGFVAAAGADIPEYNQPDPTNFDIAVNPDDSIPYGFDNDFSDSDTYHSLDDALIQTDGNSNDNSIIVFPGTYTEENVNDQLSASENSEAYGSNNPAMIVDGDEVTKVASYNGSKETKIDFDGSGGTGSAVLDVNDGATVRGLNITGDWRQFGVVLSGDFTFDHNRIPQSSYSSVGTFGYNIQVLNNSKHNGMNSEITNNTIKIIREKGGYGARGIVGIQHGSVGTNTEDYSAPNQTLVKNNVINGSDANESAPVYGMSITDGENLELSNNTVLDTEDFGIRLWKHGEINASIDTIENNSFEKEQDSLGTYFQDDSEFHSNAVEDNKFAGGVASRVNAGLTQLVTSIDNAVSYANANEIINVTSGTFNENVSIRTHNITLQGPNAGTPGYGSRTDEATIVGMVQFEHAEGSGTGGDEMNSTTVDGFQVNWTPRNNDYAVFDLGDTTGDYGPDNFIKNNIINVNASKGGNGTQAIIATTDTDDTSEVSIENNLFVQTNTDSADAEVFHHHSGPHDELNITNNEIRTDGGISLYGGNGGDHTFNVTIRGNNFTDTIESKYAPVYIADSRGDDKVHVDILENRFESGIGKGIDIHSSINTTGNDSIKITDNKFFETSITGVDHGGTGEINATYNYWGDTLGPNVTDNPRNSTTGADINGNVSFIHWYTDSSLSTTSNELLWDFDIPDETLNTSNPLEINFTNATDLAGETFNDSTVDITTNTSVLDGANHGNKTISVDFTGSTTDLELLTDSETDDLSNQTTDLTSYTDDGQSNVYGDNRNATFSVEANNYTSGSSGDGGDDTDDGGGDDGGGGGGGIGGGGTTSDYETTGHYEETFTPTNKVRDAKITYYANLTGGSVTAKIKTGTNSYKNVDNATWSDFSAGDNVTLRLELSSDGDSTPKVRNFKLEYRTDYKSDSAVFTSEATNFYNEDFILQRFSVVENEPGSTNASYRFRSGPDTTTDGDWTDWAVCLDDCSLNLRENTHIQYRVWLNGSTTSSPEVEEMSSILR